MNLTVEIRAGYCMQYLHTDYGLWPIFLLLSLCLSHSTMYDIASTVAGLSAETSSP